MKYGVIIKTSDLFQSGTDANVYLGMQGSLGSMREVQISDEQAVNDFERNDTNHASVETADLGDIKSGTLREDRSLAGSGWAVDWIKIRNEEDDREWTATVGTWSDSDGRTGKFPTLRFTLTDRGRFDEIQRQKAGDAAQLSDDEDIKRQEKEFAQQKRQIDLDLRKAKQEVELMKARAEIDKLRAGTVTPPVPTSGSGGGWNGGSPSGVRTYELFGMMNGGTVPLTQAIILDRQTGQCSVVPGARVMVGESATDGFGLGGIPGRWQMYYAGRSPSEFGQDADKGIVGWDGSRAWVFPAQQLAQIFGANWRMAIYS
jgi:hypothetical protein